MSRNIKSKLVAVFTCSKDLAEALVHQVPAVAHVHVLNLPGDDVEIALGKPVEGSFNLKQSITILA